MACYRLRRHQILVAGCRRYFLGVEVSAGTIALQASKRTGVTRSGITFCDLFKRQGKVRVGGCRVLSRQVATGRVINVLVVHGLSVPAASSGSRAIHSWYRAGVDSPCLHELKAFGKKLAAPVSGFGLIRDRVGKGHLHHFAGEARLFRSPVPEARPEAVGRAFVPAVAQAVPRDKEA